MNKLRLIGRYKNYGDSNAYDDNSEVCAIVDDFVMRQEYSSIPKDKKVALMIEPRTFIPDAYTYLESHYGDFKYVFTFDDVLLTLPNAKPIAFWWYWHTSDLPKTKGISMICSEKTFLEGHKKRREIAEKLAPTGLVDVMGKWNGGRFVEPSEALEDYKFSIAMENDRQSYYFSEKLCNCLANKVVPIYYGATKLDEFFDMDGIVYVENRDDIPEIVKNLDVDAEYAKRKKAIDKNYEIIRQYWCFDDFFYKKYGKEIQEMFE